MTDNTETREELDDKFDKALLDILENGVDISTKAGVDHIDAPHQFFEIARKRLSDLGMTKEASEGSDAAKFAEMLSNADPEVLEEHGVPEFMPHIPEEPDAAVG